MSPSQPLNSPAMRVLMPSTSAFCRFRFHDLILPAHFRRFMRRIANDPPIQCFDFLRAELLESGCLELFRGHQFANVGSVCPNDPAEWHR